MFCLSPLTERLLARQRCLPPTCAPSYLVEIVPGRTALIWDGWAVRRQAAALVPEDDRNLGVPSPPLCALGRVWLLLQAALHRAYSP
jgi:hypothetical protein